MIFLEVCLFNDKVKLIPYSDKHDMQTIKWLKDPEVYLSFGLTRRITLNSHREWVKSLKNTLIWAIYDVDNFKHQGNIILKIDVPENSAYLQIYIGNGKYRNKKIGYNSMKCVINFAFNFLDISKLWLHVFPDNVKAINLYMKLGFNIEATEKLSHYYNGEYKDQMRYSLLKMYWVKKENNN
ncbi:GNAT family N-acetyltransferase [Aquibacillus kalidii]|uniref:GNAT family N-acetyltransferase n=1 Tax=Aquibacillus kalidii TaxID=2762597 RepID=UPI001C992961|nr:GNAT family protein [Aquibacillus kalidii]